MSDDYSIWELGSRMTLSVVLAVILLMVIEVAGEVGALESAHQPVVMIAVYALVGYMVIPPLQIITTHSYRKASEVYQSRTA